MANESTREYDQRAEKAGGMNAKQVQDKFNIPGPPEEAKREALEQETGIAAVRITALNALREIHWIANEACKIYDAGEFPGRSLIALIRELSGRSYPCEIPGESESSGASA